MSLRRRFHHCVLILSHVLALSACGAGGAGGVAGVGVGGGGGGDGASVEFAERRATVTTSYDDLRSVKTTFAFSVSDIPDAGLTVLMDTDSGLFSYADILQDSDSQGRLQLELVPGGTLPPGIQEGVVTVAFCYDEVCNDHIAGSPVAIDISYDVRPEDRKVALKLVNPAAAKAVLGDPEGPITSGMIKIFNPPAEGLSIIPSVSGGDTSALSGVRVQEVPGGYQVDFQLANPSVTGIGGFNATKSFQACYGGDCSRTLQGHAPEMTVAYTVTAVPIQAMRTFDLDADDFVWNPVTGKLLLASNSPSSTGSALLALDPVSEIVTSAADASDPLGALALSPDGEIVVAAPYRTTNYYRYRAEDLSKIERAYLNPPSDFDPLYVRQLQFHPSGALAVITSVHSMYEAGIGDTRDIRILDGTVARTQKFEDPYTLALAWNHDEGSLHAYSSGHGVATLDVSAAGLDLRTRDDGIVLSPRFAYSGGRLFGSNGGVLDLATRQSVATLGYTPRGDNTTFDVVVDEMLGRVYALHRLGTDEKGDSRITAYDLETLQQLDSVVLRQVRKPTRMIRWGDRGLAMSNQIGRLYLVEGGIVDGTPAE